MGTNYIAPTWRMPENTNKDKLSNYSLDFTGSELINVSDLSNIPTGSSPRTVSAWFNSSYSGTAEPTIVSYGASATAQIFIIMLKGGSGADAGRLRFVGYSRDYTFTTADLRDNQWHHVAMTYNGTIIEAFLDGSSVGSFTPSTVLNTGTSFFKIGVQWSSWVGQIESVCIFDYVLSVEQITYLQNLNNPMAISGAEPIAYWPLGDNSNPTANAGYPNISVGADSVFDFDGSSDYINIGVPNFLNATSTFTISLWFNTDDISSQTTLCMVGSSAGQLWGLSKFEDDLIIYGGSSTNYYRKNTLFNINTWYNLIVVYDGSQSNANRYKAYVNGSLLTSPTIYGTIDTITPTFTTDFNIGRIDYAAASYFNGQISNAQIWNTDLTPAQVTTIYNNGQPLMTGAQPQASNLKAWYKLNQHDSYWDLGGNGEWTFNNAAIN